MSELQSKLNDHMYHNDKLGWITGESDSACFGFRNNNLKSEKWNWGMSAMFNVQGELGGGGSYTVAWEQTKATSPCLSGPSIHHTSQDAVSHRIFLSPAQVSELHIAS